MYPTNSLELPSAPIDRTMDQTQRRLVLKHQGQFLLLDLSGGMPAKNGAGLGLYINDTRFLNQWDITVGGEALHFLTADVDEGFAGQLVYSNKVSGKISGQPVTDPVNIAVKADSLSIKRSIVLDEKALVSETITITNHQSRAVSTAVCIAYGADFADMFEVRGDRRQKRGHMLQSRFSRKAQTHSDVTLRYHGLDRILRSTKVSFIGRRPDSLTATDATFQLHLEPQQSVQINCRITTSEKETVGGAYGAASLVRNHGRRFSFVRPGKQDPLVQARRAYDSWSAGNARITTNNSDFNKLLQRSYRDIYLLRQETVKGNAIAAGVPWFAVPFGRDSLVAGLQTLAFMPHLSRDILTFLASYQGQKDDEATCEKPGRIMHELRPGEMAGLSEIPFRPYYGTVDATQLWLMLYARYVEWTGDLVFALAMMPQAEAALNYMERELLAVGTQRFFTYGGSGALSNQGWKDSGNCIVYRDGTLARGPIAVCEAQGYAYAAWNEVAKIAAMLNLEATAKRLTELAAKFKVIFNAEFWLADQNMIALALDGEGRPCDAVASNAGHLLGTGLLSPEREKLVSDRLMRDDMFSGWGIRTLANSEIAYQPMDYQVGAVWPHDNGIIAHGMSRIGESSSAHRVAKAMLDVAVSQSDMRLPELFAGFARDGGKQPVPYQVACVPQLWAAGCPFHMVAGLLGLSYDSAAKTLTVVSAALPDWLSHIQVDGLVVGVGADAAEVNLTFARNATTGATTVEIARVKGNLRCLVEH